MANELIKVVKSRENGTGLADFREADDDDIILVGGISLKGSTSGNRAAIVANPTTADYTIAVPPTAGTAGQVLGSNGDGTTAWVAGAGDVTGPESSVDNTIPRYDGTTGKAIQGSGVTIDDSNNVGIPGQTHQQAGQRWAVATVKTANYTTTKADYLIPVDTSGGAVTITLDATPGIGQGHVVKDVGGSAQVNPISVSADVDIEGAPGALQITSQRGSLTLVYQGSLGWVVI